MITVKVENNGRKKLFSELESRIVNIHFDDLEKFIHDETIETNIEDLYGSVCENKLVNLTLPKDFSWCNTELVKSWNYVLFC